MNTYQGRFYWLDILRGAAALGVVLWHWQHFLIHGNMTSIAGEVIDRTVFPLYKIFRPFYGQGWRAVDLFFCLSGFIFFWLYSCKIRERKITLAQYAWLRFSRLYPLHFLTLVLVALGQYALLKLHGAPFIYINNTWSAFASQMFMVSSWFNSDLSALSFNGPIWSVSVEVFLYLIFFSICYFGLNRGWMLPGLILLGIALQGTDYSTIGRGLMSFFMGGLAYMVYRWLESRFGHSRRLIIMGGLLGVVLFLAVVWRYGFKQDLPFYFFELCLFPLIVVTVAVFETTLGCGPLGRRLSFLGDISYAVYLWHFPLQVVFWGAALWLGLQRSVFLYSLSLILFYLILISVAMLSYHFVERPAQRWLRSLRISN